jgi:SAM-dependent methyltransferase
VYGPLAEQIVSEFDLRDKRGTGIDLGSGPGDLILELCRRTRWMHWVNADIDPAVFAGFLQRAEAAGFRQRVATSQADAHSLPFADASADIVVSRGSYPFWKDKHKAFGEVYRVLKPGGVAYIGRGFSANLPLDVARKVRERQRRSGKEPVYDIRQAEDELRQIMRSLEIADYRIHMPSRGDVNYGIWIEFRKRATAATAVSLLEKPARESAGLELAKTTVERAAIAEQGAQSLVDALEFVPGAWIESRGRKVKQFLSFRGQKYPYPEYAIDGVLFREFHEVPYFISTGEVERVEVMRSGAAMLAGNSGMIGLIDVVPRQYQARETSVRIEYGSLGTAHGRVSHGGRAGAFSYSLGVDGFRTEGPEGRHGEERMANYHAGLTWKPSDSLSLSTNLFHIGGRRNMVQALPPATRRLQTALEWFDPIQTSFGTLNALYRPNQRLSSQLLLGYSDRHNVARAQTGSVTTFTRDWDRELTAGGTQSIALTGRNTMRAAANYNHWVAPYGKRFYTGRRCDLETYSLAVTDEQRFGSLVIDGALRYRRTYINEYGAFNIAEDANPYRNVAAVSGQWEPPAWSGSLGSAYYVSDRVSVHANLAAGTNEARKGTLTAALQPPQAERRMTADIGIRISAPGLGAGTLSMFLVERKNGINLSGEVRTVNGRLMELYENRDQDSKGLELDLRSRRFTNAVQFFFTSTVLTARIAGPAGMRKDREIPRAILAGGLLASRWGCDLNLYWKSVSSYESLRFAEPAVYRPLGGFNNVDAVLARRFGLRKQTRVYAETKNIANRGYSTVVGYPDYGRRMTIGLDYSF